MVLLSLIALLQTGKVSSQTTSNPSAYSGETPSKIPPLLKASILQLKADILTMKAVQKVDGPKLVADLQSILSAAKTSGIAIPNEVQTQFQDLIKNIQHITASGTADPNEVSKMVRGVKRQILNVLRGSK